MVEPSTSGYHLPMHKPDLMVRFRVDFGQQGSLGIGKIELLEGIARTGSLSQAAKQMRMSYRRAWLLLADLNQSFDEPVVVTAIGGRGGGGALLTAFGRRLVAGYRNMDAEVQLLAASRLAEFRRRTQAPRGEAIPHGVAATSVRRRAPLK